MSAGSESAAACSLFWRRDTLHLQQAETLLLGRPGFFRSGQPAALITVLTGSDHSTGAAPAVPVVAAVVSQRAQRGAGGIRSLLRRLHAYPYRGRGHVPETWGRCNEHGNGSIVCNLRQTFDVANVESCQ
eukprot:gene16-biopygen1232